MENQSQKVKPQQVSAQKQWIEVYPGQERYKQLDTERAQAHEWEREMQNGKSSTYYLKFDINLLAIQQCLEIPWHQAHD